jgi:hypothetical protein
MDEERFQQMEKRLNEQAEATRAMNKTLNKFLAVMANQEAARNVAPPPPASPPPVTTPLKASHSSRVNPGAPSNFDGDRAQVSGELPSPLILYFYSLFSVLLYYLLTGSISTDCDRYGHSHVM